MIVAKKKKSSNKFFYIIIFFLALILMFIYISYRNNHIFNKTFYSVDSDDNYYAAKIAKNDSSNTIKLNIIKFDTKKRRTVNTWQYDLTPENDNFLFGQMCTNYPSPWVNGCEKNLWICIDPLSTKNKNKGFILSKSKRKYEGDDWETLEKITFKNQKSLHNLENQELVKLFKNSTDSLDWYFEDIRIRNDVFLKVHLTGLTMALANYRMEMATLMAEYGDLKYAKDVDFWKPKLTNTQYYTIKEEKIGTIILTLTKRMGNCPIGTVYKFVYNDYENCLKTEIVQKGCTDFPLQRKY